jgi:hypothetical protein
MTWRTTTVVSLLLCVAVLGFASRGAAVTTDNFLLRSGTDVVALCSTTDADPLYSAAVHMCHGFGAGTYQTILAMTRHDKIAPVVCPPSAPVSRNAVVQQFLAWARQNPQHMGEPAVEVVGRFFITQFPCRPK